MSWVIAGTAIGTAALGAINASQQRKAQQQSNEANANMSAAQMQYSPWTGVKPGTPQMSAVDANPLGGAIQGGLGGAMFASALKKNQAPGESGVTGDEIGKDIGATPASYSSGTQFGPQAGPPTYGPQPMPQDWGIYNDKIGKKIGARPVR